MGIITCPLFGAGETLQRLSGPETGFATRLLTCAPIQCQKSLSDKKASASRHGKVFFPAATLKHHYLSSARFGQRLTADFPKGFPVLIWTNIFKRNLRLSFNRSKAGSRQTTCQKTQARRAATTSWRRCCVWAITGNIVWYPESAREIRQRTIDCTCLSENPKVVQVTKDIDKRQSDVGAVIRLPGTGQSPDDHPEIHTDGPNRNKIRTRYYQERQPFNRRGFNAATYAGW